MCLIKQSLDQINILGVPLMGRIILETHTPETKKDPALRQEIKDTVLGGRNDMALHLAGCDKCQAEIARRRQIPRDAMLSLTIA